MRLKHTFLVSAVALFFNSCSVTVPVAATSNQIGSKVGVASGKCFLCVLCFDMDTSVNTAAKNGGITKISTVDYRTKNYFGIVQIHECIVTGE